MHGIISCFRGSLRALLGFALLGVPSAWAQSCTEIQSWIAAGASSGCIELVVESSAVGVTQADLECLQAQEVDARIQTAVQQKLDLQGDEPAEVLGGMGNKGRSPYHGVCQYSGDESVVGDVDIEACLVQVGIECQGYGESMDDEGCPDRGGCKKFPRPGQPPEFHILGALDKSLVDGVIQKNLDKFLYCYQVELVEDPGLEGKVTLNFTIAADGSVSKSKTYKTTIDNAAVESCMNRQMMKLEFPEPKGGGIVIVKYPFEFSPG
jgi:hypothetical protein